MKRIQRNIDSFYLFFPKLSEDWHYVVACFFDPNKRDSYLDTIGMASYFDYVPYSFVKICFKHGVITCTDIFKIAHFFTGDIAEYEYIKMFGLGVLDDEFSRLTLDHINKHANHVYNTLFESKNRFIIGHGLLEQIAEKMLSLKTNFPQIIEDPVWLKYNDFLRTRTSCCTGVPNSTCSNRRVLPCSTI